MAKIPLSRTVQRIRGFQGLWKHRHELGDMVQDARAGNYQISFFTILAFIGALLYVLSPIDIIPDFFAILGWTDDLAIVYFLSNRIGKELERYRNNKPGVLKLVQP